MRVGIAILVALTLAPPGWAAGTARYWSLRALMRAIDGAPVRVGGATIHVNKETTLCSGRGTSKRVRGQRRWARFRCTYTTFAAKGVDRDVEFEVRPLDRSRFKISGAAWVRDPR